LNTLRYLLFQKVLKLSILLMGSMVNLLIVLTVSLLSGVSFIPADTYEDRVRRMKERKRRRKRDVLRRFVLNAKRKIIKIREAGEKVRPSEERSDEIVNPSLVPKAARARTSVQHAPPP